MMHRYIFFIPYISRLQVASCNVFENLAVSTVLDTGHPTFVSPILVFAFKIIPQRPHFPTCEENPLRYDCFCCEKVFIKCSYKLNETKNNKFKCSHFNNVYYKFMARYWVHTFTYSLLALWHFYKLWQIAEINHRRIPCPTQLIISLELVWTGIIFPSCTCSSCILLLF